jgi:hypothetical protein
MSKSAKVVLGRVLINTCSDRTPIDVRGITVRLDYLISRNLASLPASCVGSILER